MGTMLDERLMNAPVKQRGNCFEDFEPGRVFDHHWGRTLEVADNTLFNSATLHYNPLYFNVERAKAEGHPGVVANPMLAFCIVFGLSVEDLSERGGAFLGIDDLVFLKPVYPGDTLTARSTVVAKRESKSDPAYGIVTWLTEGFDQTGCKVLEYKRSNLVIKRSAEAA
jgi:itaconyl-CoA hydratase